MTYKAKVAVCSEIRTKHSMQRKHLVEFFKYSTWWYLKKPLGFKWLIFPVSLLEGLLGPGHN